MASVRILIADDHELVRQGLRTLLASRPAWEVCGEAADGREAVEKASQLKPDIILLDVSMPRLNGLEAAALIRRQSPRSEILIVSQHDPAQMLPSVLKVGARGFVSKSEVAHNLLSTIESIVDPPLASTAAANGSGAHEAPAFLAGGGEMGAVFRSMNWAATPLGPVESWSPTLRMMARFLLANRFPLLLWWGPDFCSLYNDAYRPILGSKHPRALGQPVRECWSEIWQVLQPLIETPYQGGPSTWMEDFSPEVNRHGFIEETHFTIAYSPVPDETVPGGIGGVLATVHEITEKVIGERRNVVLRDLGARSTEPETAEEACTLAAHTLARYVKDIPFALLYLIDPARTRAALAGAAGVHTSSDDPLRTVTLTQAGSRPRWPLPQVLESGEIQLVEHVAEVIPELPTGPWSDPPDRAAVVPIRSNTPHRLAGFLVAGLSPRLRFDDRYRNFLELVSGQIATTIANARSYEEERRLRQRSAQFEFLLNQAPLGVYLVDRDLRIRQVNPIARPAFGPIADLEGRDFSEVLHLLREKDYADEVVRIFRHTLETGEPYHTSERERPRSDGTGSDYFEWRINRIPLPEGGYGVVCYFRDISVEVQARAALQDARDSLESRVRERTEELERAYKSLRVLSVRMMQMQDEDRRRIARDLHDSAGQLLAALGMELAALNLRAAAISPQLANDIDSSHQLVQQLTQEIRTASYLLHPPLLDDAGLSGALRWYVSGLSQRSGIAITLELDEELGRLPRELEAAVFHIVQESLANIHRHSASKTAALRISRRGGQILLEIEDQGIGIAADKLREIQTQGSGVGIAGMRERVLHFNGNMRITSESTGTRIAVTFPVPAEAAPAIAPACSRTTR